MSEQARGIPARIGIAALNLISPGLGLLRVQKPKAALAFLCVPVAMLGLIVLVYLFSPTLDFRGWAALVIASLTIILLAYVGSIAMTWGASRLRSPTGPWWSRWYGIIGVTLLLWTLAWPVPDITLSTYKTFYLPAESMAPTLLRNDRLVASMRGPGTLHRGDIIILDVGPSMYIKRIAALPGDRIEMVGGVVILNGHPIAQRYLRTDAIDDDRYDNQARRLSEQFPGEAAPHEIYDLGYTQGDDMPEQVVAPDHVFVLGDNRDASADSRFSRAEQGVEQLPIADIRGRALFYLWGPSGRLGEALNR